jgi:putative oxidoreductase
MENAFGKLLEKYQASFYVVFRVFVGLLFFQHGAQKLLGWFGAQQSAALFSLMGLAGFIELFGGLAIALGLLTRLSALGGIATMIGAYFMVHFPKGWIPIMNKGELALLYFAAFLVLIVYGAGKFSLEKALFKKELF